VRPAPRGCAPVQRAAASRASSSAARFSASLTGSQAPYAASSDSSAEISALRAPRRARSAARVSWGAQRLPACGRRGRRHDARSRAARVARRRLRRGRPRAVRRSRLARPVRLRAGSGPGRGAYIDGECGGKAGWMYAHEDAALGRVAPEDCVAVSVSGMGRGREKVQLEEPTLSVWTSPSSVRVEHTASRVRG
jgi:hypothetical protein